MIDTNMGVAEDNRFVDIKIDSEEELEKKANTLKKQRKPDKKKQDARPTQHQQAAKSMFNFKGAKSKQPLDQPKVKKRQSFDLLLSNLNDMKLYSDEDDDEEEDDDDDREEGRAMNNLDLSYDLSRKDPILNSSTLSGALGNDDSSNQPAFLT